MKIGLSYSRCVRDIAAGDVAINDVLVIISQTNFDPMDNDQWEQIWEGYAQSQWSEFKANDEPRIRELTIDLQRAGKLFQPRKEGARQTSWLQYYWLDAILTTEDLENNPAVKLAWEKFLTIAGLTSTQIINKY